MKALLARYGLSGPKLRVIAPMWLAGLFIALYGTPFAINVLGVNAYGILRLIADSALGLLSVQLSMAIYSRTMVPYVSLPELLALPRTNGMVAVNDVNRLQPQRVLKTDFGTNTEFHAVTNTFAMAVGIPLMIAMYFAFVWLYALIDPILRTQGIPI